MANVFISYKKEDASWARRIDDALQAEGFSVFWDDSLTPDKAWDTRLEQELAAAHCVLVLWSPRSIGSTWVRNEAHFGNDHGKLAPAMIEKCEAPLAFRLNQTIDLCNWTGDRNDKRWRKLVTWIADLADGVSQTEKQTVDPAAIAARQRTVMGTLPSGEPIWDGATISAATPAGSAFRDGVGLPVMRIIPAGEYVMGSPIDEAGRRTAEGPQKRVKIARPLGVGVYPLTRAELRTLLGGAFDPPAAPPRQKGGFLGLLDRKKEAPAKPALAEDGALPAVDLSLDVARQAAARLGELTGERYRLPSESEWEYACRAGSRGSYCWGEAITPDRALYGATAPRASGAFRPNDFGLYDMHGNVREWTLDLWHEDLVDTPPDGAPSLTGQSAMNVVRGGSFMDGPEMLRSAARGRATATVGNPATGVRLIREIR